MPPRDRPPITEVVTAEHRDLTPGRKTLPGPVPPAPKASPHAAPAPLPRVESAPEEPPPRSMSPPGGLKLELGGGKFKLAVPAALIVAVAGAITAWVVKTQQAPPAPTETPPTAASSRPVPPPAPAVPIDTPSAIIGGQIADCSARVSKLEALVAELVRVQLETAGYNVKAFRLVGVVLPAGAQVPDVRFVVESQPLSVRPPPPIHVTTPIPAPEKR